MTSIATALPVDRPSTWAVAGGACGLAAAIGSLPSAVKALLLLAFVAVGPGSALLQYWRRDLPPFAQRALVPVLGLAVVILVVSGSLMLGEWAPRVVLLALAAATVVLGASEVARRSDR